MNPSDHAGNPSEQNGKPIVFIAGGIGVTPLLSMAKSLVVANLATPIYFLQAARNSSVHAMADEVRSLAGKRLRMILVVGSPGMIVSHHISFSNR